MGSFIQGQPTSLLVVEQPVFLPRQLGDLNAHRCDLPEQALRDMELLPKLAVVVSHIDDLLGLPDHQFDTSNECLAASGLSCNAGSKRAMGLGW